MSALPPEPPYGSPASTRWRLSPCLAVDLIALDAGGRVAWTWIARHWHGADVVVALELAPEQWPPSSWRGYASTADVERMRLMAGGRAAEARVCPVGEDLDKLMRRPRMALVVSVWAMDLPL